jgi:hypothetical protein
MLLLLLGELGLLLFVLAAVALWLCAPRLLPLLRRLRRRRRPPVPRAAPSPRLDDTDAG